MGQPASSPFAIPRNSLPPARSHGRFHPKEPRLSFSKRVTIIFSTAWLQRWRPTRDNQGSPAHCTTMAYGSAMRNNGEQYQEAVPTADAVCTASTAFVLSKVSIVLATCVVCTASTVRASGNVLPPLLPEGVITGYERSFYEVFLGSRQSCPRDMPLRS